MKKIKNIELTHSTWVVRKSKTAKRRSDRPAKKLGRLGSIKTLLLSNGIGVSFRILKRSVLFESDSGFIQ